MKTITKMHYSIFAMAILLAAVMGSCAPRVIAEPNPYLNLKSTNPDDVVVYDQGVMPDSAKVIGTVKVTDSGMTSISQGSYPSVLQCAREATAKAGGNALFVREHKEPSIWVTTHRIKCDMLHIANAVADSTAAVNTMERCHKAESELQLQRVEKLEKHKMHEDMLSVGLGYAWLSNKFYDGSSMIAMSTSGFDIAVEYSHLWPIQTGSAPFYMGFTINGLYNNMSCKPTRNYYHINSFSMNNYYLGAGWKIAYKTTGRFVWNYSVGIGYAQITNGMYGDNEHCFGMTSELGIGYQIGKNTILGVSMNILSTRSKEPKDWPSDVRYGISHGGLHLKLSVGL